jgi:hypothetical protein
LGQIFPGFTTGVAVDNFENLGIDAIDFGRFVTETIANPFRGLLGIFTGQIKIDNVISGIFGSVLGGLSPG